jgi:pimeloyl-ACP methyl ester carboxylesterase
VAADCAVIDRGSGTPVVLLPGLQGRWEWMAPAVDALAERCRVVTFSLCDEPTSGFRFDPSRGVENYFTQLDEVFRRTGLDAAVIVGVSFSGPIVTEFAARHPQRVRGLVLASALPPDWTPNARARFYMRAPVLLSPVFLIDAPTRSMKEIRTALPRFGQRVQFTAEQAARVVRSFVSPIRMARRIRRHDHHRFSDPSAIDRPVLLITGEDGLDRVVPPELTRRYLRWLPQARHVVLERTGHLGLVTRPSAFADLVAGFADEVSQHDRRASA